MITNKVLLIATGVLIWILGVSFFITSYQFPIIENQDQQANIFLAFGIIPSSCFGTYLFYTKGVMKPNHLALSYVIIVVILDILITVPVFIIPNGGNYSEFFSDPVFYTIAIELYFIVYYYAQHLTQK